MRISLLIATSLVSVAFADQIMTTQTLQALEPVDLVLEEPPAPISPPVAEVLVVTTQNVEVPAPVQIPAEPQTVVTTTTTTSIQPQSLIATPPSESLVSVTHTIDVPAPETPKLVVAEQKTTTAAPETKYRTVVKEGDMAFLEPIEQPTVTAEPTAQTTTTPIALPLVVAPAPADSKPATTTAQTTAQITPTLVALPVAVAPPPPIASKPATTIAKPSGYQDLLCAQWASPTVCTRCAPRSVFKGSKCVAVSDLCDKYNSKTGACTSCFSGYTLQDGSCVFSSTNSNLVHWHTAGNKW